MTGLRSRQGAWGKVRNRQNRSRYGPTRRRCMPSKAAELICPVGRPPSRILQAVVEHAALCCCIAVGLHVPTPARPERPCFLKALVAGVFFGGAVGGARERRTRGLGGRIGARGRDDGREDHERGAS